VRVQFELHCKFNLFFVCVSLWVLVAFSLSAHFFRVERIVGCWKRCASSKVLKLTAKIDLLRRRLKIVGFRRVSLLYKLSS
jgi:hypothetical protein